MSRKWNVEKSRSRDSSMSISSPDLIFPRAHWLRSASWPDPQSVPPSRSTSNCQLTNQDAPQGRHTSPGKLLTPSLPYCTSPEFSTLSYNTRQETPLLTSFKGTCFTVNAVLLELRRTGVARARFSIMLFYAPVLDATNSLQSIISLI